ncbi:hypothetical protein [Speluncibacter jeojiensis]|uniref:DUF11 domain-containing protein n=1 Tax=Speluncibacter jeojiensis TaxID=2710754 RepID=A0A9X4LXM8_9ACTN|nr:hypothetical protein [Rhodococcus sp. D2-41]MDG3013169.1 hypothetical protein [Corynebacteriales bacterium D3-21]
MSRISMRRAVATAAAATMVGAGLTVGLGSGIAAAADAPVCSASSHATKNDISTVGVTHTYDKSVTEQFVAVGTTVTYKIVVGTTGIGNPYVNTITDYPPTGFGKPISASVTAYHLGIPNGQQTEKVTPEPNGAGWKVTSTGWFVNSGNPVTATFTYAVPAAVKVGQQITSGGISTAGTVGVGTTLTDLTACFTARAKNAGESVTGSLGQSGLGSSEGQLSSTGSVSDVLGDAIGKAIGGIL